MKLFGKIIIDISLKANWNISLAKMHKPILKVAQPSIDDRSSFVIFSDYHLIINISKI